MLIIKLDGKYTVDLADKATNMFPAIIDHIWEILSVLTNLEDGSGGMVCWWICASKIFVWKRVNSNSGQRNIFKAASHHTKCRRGVKQNHITISHRHKLTSGAYTIGLIVHYIIVALCRLCLHSSLQQPMTSAWYNDLVNVLAGCMPAQLIIEKMIGW